MVLKKQRSGLQVGLSANTFAKQYALVFSWLLIKKQSTSPFSVFCFHEMPLDRKSIFFYIPAFVKQHYLTNLTYVRCHWLTWCFLLLPSSGMFVMSNDTYPEKES